jgi:hypothetical protein
MLTKADDYPIHQTPDPIAYAGSDRNFYDRYFFQGFRRDGSVYFALAFGVYPLRDVMDAGFAVVRDGVEHCVRASRVMGLERMDTAVGPISIEVVEPLRVLRVRVGENEHGLRAELNFEALAPPIEEPRFFRRVGPQVMMDLTRLTQHGRYSGWIEVDGERIEVGSSDWLGVRDRSWGIRPVGEQAPPGAVQAPPQFYWLWAPLHFENGCVLFDVNEDAEGRAWHANGVWIPRGGEPETMRSCGHRLEFRSGTRHAKSAEIVLQRHSGEAMRIELEPLYEFYMLGIGYGHPQEGHGRYRGELAVTGERIALASVDQKNPFHQHVQAFCRARMGEREGAGILEQLIIGPHAPSGFKELLDVAP